MEKFEFVYTDFCPETDDAVLKARWELVAAMANKRLKEMLVEAPKCTGQKYGDGWVMSQSGVRKNDTHTAKLVCIEKIEEKQ